MKIKQVDKLPLLISCRQGAAISLTHNDAINLYVVLWIYHIENTNSFLIIGQQYRCVGLPPLKYLQTGYWKMHCMAQFGEKVVGIIVSDLTLIQLQNYIKFAMPNAVFGWEL